jgi:hypothetical protein
LPSEILSNVSELSITCSLQTQQISFLEPPEIFGLIPVGSSSKIKHFTTFKKYYLLGKNRKMCLFNFFCRGYILKTAIGGDLIPALFYIGHQFDADYDHGQHTVQIRIERATIETMIL